MIRDEQDGGDPWGVPLFVVVTIPIGQNSGGGYHNMYLALEDGSVATVDSRLHS